MKTTRFFMMFVAAAAMMFASCDKDNTATTSTENNGGSNGGGNGGGTDETRSLWYTRWEIETGDYGEANYVNVYVTFTNYSARVHWMLGLESDDYSGSYTYSNGNGTIELEDIHDVHQGTATFSISGSTMTLNLLGETYQLPKYVVD